MMGKTAVITAQVANLAVAPHVYSSWREFVGGAVLAGVAAYLPDLDHAGSTASKKVGKRASGIIRKSTGGHRGGMHSLVMIGLAYALAYWLFRAEFAAWSIAIGWASHVWTDFLTHMGVALFWPVWRRKFRIPLLHVTTGGKGEFVYLVLVVVAGWLVLFNYAAAFLSTQFGASA